jgi:hypothetical protein
MNIIYAEARWALGRKGAIKTQGIIIITDVTIVDLW